MGFIERTYTNTMTLLDSLGQTQFESVASQIGGTAQILSALVAVLVLFNMALQVRPTEAGTSIWLIFKLVLVALFMQSWADFNGVFGAIEEGFEVIGNALLAGGLGSGETSTSFPRELDNLAENMGAYANVTAGRLNILGGMINALMFGAIAIFGALATLAMVASRVVLAVLVGLAPFAILATLTTQTKSYFETWLSGTIKVLMFPLILIGIFATILGMGNATIASLDPDNIDTIGQITPVLTVLVLASFLVILSPLIVTLVAGDFALGAVTAVASGGLRRAAGSAGSFAGGTAGRAAGGAAAGAAGQAPGDGASRSGRAGNYVGGAARGAVANTASFAKNPIANTRDGVNLRANQINRATERMARLRRK
jgi:type IV secretion system protein VirB6